MLRIQTAILPAEQQWISLLRYHQAGAAVWAIASGENSWLARLCQQGGMTLWNVSRCRGTTL